MTVYVLSMVVAFLLCVLTYAGVIIKHLTEELHRTRLTTADEGHASCLSQVSAYVSDVYAAQVLMAAAESLSGMDGQAALRRIANTMWTEDSDPVPSLWLRERADSLLERSAHQ